MNTAILSSSLREVVSALHKGLRKQTTAINNYSMTELETIGHLMRTPALCTELASLTRITTQSMSQILSKMAEQGVIKKSPSKDDKRKVYVSLTSAGKRLIEKNIDERDEWLKNVIEKSISNKEKEILIKAIPF